MIYFDPTGVLRASHRKTDPTRALHPQYPFHTHDEVQKVTSGETVCLEIGLWAIGIDFDAGERLSVQVSGEYPLVDEFQGERKSRSRRGIKGHIVCTSGVARRVVLYCRSCKSWECSMQHLSSILKRM